jgi:transposase-like protein
MPWKKSSPWEQRLELVREMARRKVSFQELCQSFGVSRQTAYKWWLRYRTGRRRALRDKSRRPLVNVVKTSALWRRRVRAARLKHPTWGARKLRHILVHRLGENDAPATATISRWLKGWGPGAWTKEATPRTRAFAQTVARSQGVPRSLDGRL